MCPPRALVSRVAPSCASASRFAPSGESLLSNATKGTKRSCPGHPVFRLGRKIPSLIRSFRGTRRRAIPGPSPLSRHPCRSTPETPIQRGLLNGAFGVCGCFTGRLIKPEPERGACFSCRSELAREPLNRDAGWPIAGGVRSYKNIRLRGSALHPRSAGRERPITA